MAAGLLLWFESVRLLVDLAIESCTDLEHSRVMSFLGFYGGAGIILSGGVLVVILRGESIARVFAIDRRRPIRLAAAIAGGIVGVVVLASVLAISLRWLGLVPSGADPNRYFSNELYLPFESWVWRAPLLLLWATTEEVLYRGALHEGLRRAVPILPAAVLGSFVFAAAHTRPLGATVSTFAIGVVLVWLRERLRSLAPSTACHFLWNVLVVAIRG
jgi:membrane protease YdiL (CAAX protease family)